MSTGTARDRQHLSRVPPHDDVTEAHLLGIAMLSRPAAEVVAGIRPDDFYRPRHATIAEVMAHLVTASQPVDAGTVAAELRLRGQLDAIADATNSGSGYLVSLVSAAPSYGAAPHFAELIQGYARKRRALLLLSESVEAIYSNLPLAGLVAELSKAAEEDAEARSSGWEAYNLAATLAGDGMTAEATFLARTDGKGLLYPGKVHAFNAESEAGKSWLALWACAERINAGEHVVYLDFEAGPTDIVERLLALGLGPTQILEQFHYVRPAEPIDAGARLRMVALVKDVGATLFVLDGVAEALALSGWDENAATDIASFYGMMTRPIAREGAAVVTIDHLVKDKERQGNDARGSGHKRAGIDGAQYRLDVVRPFARGADGMARVTVTKDRHGWVRSFAAGGKTVGELHLRSSHEGKLVTVEIRPSAATDERGAFRPTGYMERVSKVLESSSVPVSAGWIEREVGGNHAHSRLALKLLVAEGYVAVERKGQALLHTLAKRFREHDQPPQDEESDSYGDGDF